MIKVLEFLEKNKKVLEYFGSDETKRPKILTRCFADTKEEVVKGATIEGLPVGCDLAVGSEVITANGAKARLKSDGNWVWLAKADLITRTITENGTYEAADDNADGYVEVTVNVPESTLVEKSITANGTYDPADDEADGYSGVTVNVPATKYDVQGTFPIYEGEVYSVMTASQTTDMSEYPPFDMVINFPEEGSTIGRETCAGWRGLHTVNIPNHYTDIGEGTFNLCHDLVHINIPTSVTQLKDYIFRGCAFTSMNIPEGVTTIGSYAFSECANLTTVIIPSTVTEIGTEAFGSCTALVSVTCNATTPPSLGSEVFIDTSSNLVIYVPAESISAYGSSQWSGLNIQAIPTT